MLSSRKISLGVVFLNLQISLSLSAAGRAQQVRDIEWQDQSFFTESDRHAIPALAKMLGIQSPKRVSHGEYLPTFCPYVMIESAYSENAHLRIHFQLYMHRNDWKCWKPDRVKTKRVGQWFADASELVVQKEWRIEDGQWVKYVNFSEDVSFEDADIIILAIKHGKLVNRSSQSVMPTIDPMGIISIRIATRADRTFEVETPQEGYIVRIFGSLVELREIRVRTV